MIRAVMLEGSRCLLHGLRLPPLWGLVLGGSWGSTLALAYAQVRLQDTAAVRCWLRAVVPECRFD